MERPMISLKELGEKLAATQDENLAKADRDRDNLAEVRERLFGDELTEYHQTETRPLVMGFGISAFALAVAAAVLLLVFYPNQDDILFVDDGEMTVAPGEWISASETISKTIRFSDNSKLILCPGASIRVMSMDKSDAHILLDQGKAHVDVVHGPDTDWVIDVGPYKVNIIGTEFDVSWNPERQLFSLTLVKGVVNVTGPMIPNGRRIAKKETIKAWVKEKRMEISSAPDKTKEGASSTFIASSSSEGGETQAFKGEVGSGKTIIVPLKKQFTKSVPKSSWVSLNRKGRFDDIIKEAHSIGIKRVLNSVSAEELIALGDAFRLRGKRELAEDAYVSVRKRFPGTKSSSRAAYALGKIAFDTSRRYNKAVGWLEIYLRERPTGSLAREALGRLIEAKKQVGDVKGAKAAATDYLSKYPNGPHASTARAIANHEKGGGVQ